MRTERVRFLIDVRVLEYLRSRKLDPVDVAREAMRRPYIRLRKEEALKARRDRPRPD